MFHGDKSEAPFGKYLFGDERGLKEPNNSREKLLLQKFREVFTGDMRALTPGEIRTLVSLRDAGKYCDVLSVPREAARAWRIVELDIENHPDLLQGCEDRFFPRPVKFSGNLRMPMRPGYTVVSWTISKDSARDMIKKSLDKGNTLVLMSANLDKQRDKFLLNPEELENVNELYSWQNEIWQISAAEIDTWSVMSSEKLGVEVSDDDIAIMVDMTS